MTFRIPQSWQPHPSGAIVLGKHVYNSLKYIVTNEVSTLEKRVVQSRSELISIFATVNTLLRGEGLQQGLERFTEFANILFLKVLSEIENGKEECGEQSAIDPAYRWDHFRDRKALSY